MTYFFQLLVSGIAVGCVYSLAALGFVLTYKSGRVLNFAHGQMIALGSCLTYSLNAWAKAPMPLALFLGVLLTGGLGWLCERLFLRHMIQTPVIIIALMTIALASLFDGILLLTPFIENEFSFPSLLPKESITIWGVHISWPQLVGIIFSTCLIGLLSLFFQYSKLGIAMRATSDDSIGAQVCGISISKVYSLTWFLSGITAAVSGIVITLITGLNIGSLVQVGLLVFPAVVLGGMDSIPGAIVGGMIIGVLQQLSVGYLDGTLGLQNTGTVIPYVILILILLIKPQGLFGTHQIERV